MSVIERCVYVDGELIAPGLRATLDAQPRLALKSGKFFPTFDIGFYHVFRITAHGLPPGGRGRCPAQDAPVLPEDEPGRGPQHPEARQARRLHPINENYEIAYDITYVIERTGSRTQNPDSPYPEYQQDLRKLTFVPETAAVLAGR